MPLEIKDLGMNALRAELAKLSTLRVTPGIQGEEAERQHPNADASVGKVAHWMQFGTTDADGNVVVPARPFVDVGIVEMKQRLKADMARAMSDLINRRADTAVEALAKNVGEPAAAAVRHAIDTSREWAEPLAASTIAAKGHDQPLLDSGTLRDSVTYAIRKGDEIVRKGTGLE